MMKLHLYDVYIGQRHERCSVLWYDWSWQVEHKNPRDHRQRGRAIEHGGQGTQTEIEWLYMSGWVYWVPLFVCILSAAWPECALSLPQCLPSSLSPLMVDFKTMQPWRDSGGWSTWGRVEDDIKVLGRWRGDKWDFRGTERRLCCIRCLGRDWSLTNVVWYTEYWKQGQGFLPGHEFLGWSFCLIGQLDHFPNTFQQKRMQLSSSWPRFVAHITVDFLLSVL